MTFGLISLQIGIMFGVLFVMIALENFTQQYYIDQIITNQETIISFLNSTGEIKMELGK